MWQLFPETPSANPVKAISDAVMPPQSIKSILPWNVYQILSLPIHDHPEDIIHA